MAMTDQTIAYYVYRVTKTDRGTYGFGPRIDCATRHEANVARRKIALDAARTREDAYPVIYDTNMNPVRIGWERTT